MNTFNTQRRSCRGQALVEFVLMLPLLILLLFAASQGAELLLQRGRVFSAQWFALRAGSFDEKHRHGGLENKSTLEANIKQHMFDQTTSDLSISIDSNVGWFPVNTGSSLLDANNVIMNAYAIPTFIVQPRQKKTTVTVKFKPQINPSTRFYQAADFLTEDGDFSYSVTRSMMVSGNGK